MLTALKTTLLITLLCVSSVIYAGKISKNEAANSAQRAYSGRVLSVKLKKSFYKVKIINSNGQVRVIRVNAKSGQIQ